MLVQIQGFLSVTPRRIRSSYRNAVDSRAFTLTLKQSTAVRTSKSRMSSIISYSYQQNSLVKITARKLHKLNEDFRDFLQFLQEKIPAIPPITPRPFRSKVRPIY